MKILTFLIIVAGVFFILLGFFPIVFYIIWSIQNSMSRKKAQEEKSGRREKHYLLTRLKELRDNPRIQL